MAGANGYPARRVGQAPHQQPSEEEQLELAQQHERWLQHQRALAAAGHPPADYQAPHQSAPRYHEEPPPNADQGHGGYHPVEHAPPQPQPRHYHDPATHDPVAHSGHPGYAQPPLPDYRGQPLREPHHYQDDDRQPPPFQNPAPGARQGYAPPPSGQEAYAPNFERYDPSQPSTHDPRMAPRPPGGHDPHDLGMPPARETTAGREAPHFHPQREEPGFQPGYEPEPHAGAHGGLHGHPHDHANRHPEDFAPHDPRLPPAQHQQDHQNWDLSSYAPGQIPPDYAGHQQQPAHQAQDWQHGSGHEPYPGAPQSDYPHPGPHGAGGIDPYHPAAPGTGMDPHAAASNQDYGAEEFDDEDEPRKGPSTLVIVSALAGAIVLGGGMAYGYKMIGGGSSNKSRPPVVKANVEPARVRPVDPGGKTIENKGKTFLNRLGNEQPVPTTLAAPAVDSQPSDVAGTANKVRTIPIVVNRDGSLSPQAREALAPPPAAASSGVPGLVIDGLGPPPGAANSPPPLRNAANPAIVNAAQPAPSAPRVADLPLPKVNPQPVRPVAPVRQAAKAPVRDDLLANRSSAGATTVAAAVPVRPRAPTRATSSNGYVTVLASKRDRQSALNSFADLHAQYPDILTGHTPDVREVNLGEKGIWYRLIVGPPGSRNAARSLCVKLKARGMGSCWPVAY